MLMPLPFAWISALMPHIHYRLGARAERFASPALPLPLSPAAAAASVKAPVGAEESMIFKAPRACCFFISASAGTNARAILPHAAKYYSRRARLLIELVLMFTLISLMESISRRHRGWLRRGFAGHGTGHRVSLMILPPLVAEFYWRAPRFAPAVMND